MRVETQTKNLESEKYRVCAKKPRLKISFENSISGKELDPAGVLLVAAWSALLLKFGEILNTVFLTLHCLFEMLFVRNGTGADVCDAKFVEILYCIFNPALPI